MTWQFCGDRLICLIVYILCTIFRCVGV